MQEPVQRSNKTTYIKILEQNIEKEYNFDYLKQKYQINGMIRILKEDYQYLPEKGSLYQHYNLQPSNHLVGGVYLFAKIERQGYFISSDNEELPLLNLDNCFYGECLSTKKVNSYDNLTEEDFQYSMSSIKNKEQLKQAILKRYSVSVPKLTKEEILKIGLSQTTLRIK